MQSDMKKAAIVVFFINLKKSISVKIEFMQFPFVNTYAFVEINIELIHYFTNDTLFDPVILREYPK